MTITQQDDANTFIRSTVILHPAMWSKIASNCYILICKLSKEFLHYIMLFKGLMQPRNIPQSSREC